MVTVIKIILIILILVLVIKIGPSLDLTCVSQMRIKVVFSVLGPPCWSHNLQLPETLDLLCVTALAQARSVGYLNQWSVSALSPI